VSRRHRDIDIVIGARLRLFRARKPQAWLAAILGVSIQQVGKYESGDNAMSAARLKILSDATGRTPEWFLQREPRRMRLVPKRKPKPVTRGDVDDEVPF
jgi:transcriptional regulator with XRE-family HTH domain